MSYYLSGFEAIKDFSIKASNTGSFSGEEVTLYTGQHPDDTTTSFVNYSFSNSNAYKYYRTEITSHWPGNGGAQRIILEIEMHEVTSPSNPPSYSNFSTAHGTTNFSAVSDLTAVENMTLATAYGKINWINNVSAEAENYDANVRIGNGFVSLNISAILHSNINKSANITLQIPDCNNVDVYYTSGFYSNLTDMILNGIKIVDNANSFPTACDDGTSAGDVCNTVTCSGGTLTIEANHFDGFASGDNATLTIYNSQLTDDCQEDITFYANYTNITDDHIPGADCNITFEDTGTFDMAEDPGVNYYYSRTQDWAAAATYNYTVNCSVSDGRYDNLQANDTITFTTCSGGGGNTIPEFNLIGIILIAFIAVVGYISVMFIHKKK